MLPVSFIWVIIIRFLNCINHSLWINPPKFKRVIHTTGHYFFTQKIIILYVKQKSFSYIFKLIFPNYTIQFSPDVQYCENCISSHKTHILGFIYVGNKTVFMLSRFSFKWFVTTTDEVMIRKAKKYSVWISFYLSMNFKIFSLLDAEDKLNAEVWHKNLNSYITFLCPILIKQWNWHLYVKLLNNWNFICTCKSKTSVTLVLRVHFLNEFF